MKCSSTAPCLAAVMLFCAMAARARGESKIRRAGEDVGSSNECVILIHGLGRTAWSMKRLEWVLKRQGYAVINESYASTRLSIEEAADFWLSEILRRSAVQRADRVHFVTHSAGGLVLREYLTGHTIVSLGRVVMLAPPNQGSELVDRLKHSLLFRRVTGPAGQELGTDSADLPQRLPPARFELGVVAGNRSLNPLFSAWIPGPDDGKVSVARAGLAGMKEMLVVPRTHTWMMWRQDVTFAVERFLKRGTFTPGLGNCRPGFEAD